MKKEMEIQEVKNRIIDFPNFTNEEKEFLLKEIDNGKLFDFGTGYASIDRPWLKFYKIDEYFKIENDKTIYQDILYQNQDYLNSLAILYFGGKITYNEMFKKIDETAKSLEEYGIKKGDFVTVCCAGIPECIYTIYALAKIGAIANLMAPYFDSKQMSDRISDCESKTLIVLDSFYPQIKESIKNSTIEKTIVIPTLNSSPLRFLPKKNGIKLNYVNELWWKQFIKDGNKRTVPQTMRYEKDYPLCMVYSSGTTGASKAILLSHDSFQYSVLSYDANTVDVIRGQKMYQIIPPWYSTGFNTSIHLPLHKGLMVFQDPRFEREIFVNNIVKQKVDYAVAPTSMYEGFLDEKLVKGKKLTNFQNPFEGGEPLTTEVKTKIEDVFKKMGVDSTIKIGYGQCECGAQATSQSQHIKHVEGSVGLPIPGVMISIFDDDFNELPYMNRGNILVSTPCGMLEYFKNPEATENYFYYDKQGRKWNCTGDIGYLAPNGDLFIEGRKEDYTMVNGNKVYNFDIENVVRGIDGVKNCDCIAKPSEDGTKELGLHLILSNEQKEIISDYDKLIGFIEMIQKKIYEKYSNADMIPNYFKIRDSFPYKPSGKRDVEALGNEIDNFIYVDKNNILSKQNMSNVYKLKKKK